MKRFTAVLLLFCTILILSAQEWTVFSDPRLTPEMAAAIKNEVNELKLKDGTVIKGIKKLAKEPTHKVDLRLLLKPRGLNKTQSIAVAAISSPEDCVKTIGYSADWFYTLHFNNELVTDRLKEGNHVSVSPFGHVKDLHFRKGKNIVVFFIRPGGAGYSLFFGEVPRPFNDIILKKVLIEYHYPRRSDLRVNPFITYLKNDRFAISVQLYNTGLVRIKYREPGSKKFHYAQNVKAGLNENSEFHNVRLPELKAGKYEYFVEVSSDYFKYQSFGPWQFTIPDLKKQKYSLLFLADTQFYVSDHYKMSAQLAKRKAFDNVDMIIHMGDLQHRCDEYERLIMDVFFKPYVKYSKGAIPLMVLRGNHEYNGEDAFKYITHFGDSYAAMQIGDVFYLILDTGGFWKYQPMLYNFNSLWKEQEAWVQKVVQTEAWKKAKYHVVLAHKPPVMDGGKNYPAFIGKLFLGKNPKQKVDLWICGHTHWAARWDIASQQYLTARKVLDRKGKVRTQYSGGKQPIYFPVIVMDGSSRGLFYSTLRLEADKEGIHLIQRDMNDNIMDELMLMPTKELKVLRTQMKPIPEWNR